MFTNAALQTEPLPSRKAFEAVINLHALGGPAWTWIKLGVYSCQPLVSDIMCWNSWLESDAPQREGPVLETECWLEARFQVF